METAGIRAVASVLGKALSPLSDGVLEAWGASSMLGSNMEDLKLELLEAQAMLHNVRGREIHNPALAQLLDMLRQLAYGADDVLDELDYFRIQDELDGTYHAAHVHAAGCVKDLALHARHTARACVNKLKFPMCLRAARRNDPDEQDGGDKQGFLSGVRLYGGQSKIGSSRPSPDNKTGLQEVHGGCMPKAAHNVGKHFSCFSFLPAADHDAPTGVTGNPNMTEKNEPLQTPKLKFDRVKMSTRILDIIKQLKPVCAKVSHILSLELQNSSHNPAQDIVMNRPKTTPQIIEPKLYGRDTHKKIVVDKIVNGEFHELTVLPIVGPGGIGKTTFTQHVYKQMRSHFQVSIWICVSQDFNANRLSKEIVKKIPEITNNEKDYWSDEERIMQRIKEKRVLLVLDDVWPHHENEWKKVIALFKKEGAKGIMVIVTTRIPEVADTVKTNACSLELERLCPADTMSFFEECVFGDQKPWVDHPELFDVGSKIVGKLKGSPLAAKTVGRLLRNKLTLNHWTSVLESKKWESQTNENDIMPALKLSYDYLPFHLQQCFSFCALFPEDYEYDSEELVYLWVGLDILHCDHKNNRIEDVGLCYLDELINYGFFKMNKNEGERPSYVIHDLLHELAVKVSSYDCLSVYSSNVRHIKIPPFVRHLSIIVDNKDVKDRLSFENYAGNLSLLDKQLKVEHLRTLMLFGEYHGSFSKTFADLFKEATALRAVLLSEASYNLEDILGNFSKLVHLRYLRIKSSLDHREFYLPSAMFRLYHLEVIDLQSAYPCVSSTRNMNNLVKLHHFLVPKYELHLHSDIYGAGKLKFIQELRRFRVRKESDGFEPSQLGPLTEIGGSLGIYNLENVQTKEEANEIKLIHKNHLRELILEWEDKRPNIDPVKEESVLGSLVPHSNLQELCVRGHGGTSCPAWLCENLSVKCLESLCLDGVSWKNLPSLGEMWMVNELGEEYRGSSILPRSFHNLKRLELSNISRLKKWVGNGACPLFSCLEVLTIRCCSELIELPFSHSTWCEAQWEEKMAWFPRLEELVIAECPKLESLPPIPWRTHGPCSADLEQVGTVECLQYPASGPKLRLNIEGKGGHGNVFWNALNFSSLTSLEELNVSLRKGELCM
uniref:AAA+ ATPase domain-containing protein n=6 Tax=Aegilops tauschii TaxID=37682 RepID=A0A453D0Y1_AEGTS